MELCNGGELCDRLLKIKSFNEKACANLVQQMLRAVNYMHVNGFVHRDVRGETFLKFHWLY